jgi:hypothetical protein
VNLIREHHCDKANNTKLILHPGVSAKKRGEMSKRSKSMYYIEGNLKRVKV